MENKCFEEIKGVLGFGCMRLPIVDGVVDTVRTSEMFDEFIRAGFNYFDTAHGYLKGESERAIKTCLADRYPRDSYILTNKLTQNLFNKREDIRKIFSEQLALCGVEYFDFYLMHAQDRTNYEKYKSCFAYEEAIALKREGLIRHLGISFHDTAEVLDRILTDYPEIEVVQLQFNYADYEDSAVQAKRCYEVAREHGKPIMVMEPVKGGVLVKNLPDEAREIFSSLGGTPASYALRFASSFEGVVAVLSGMGDIDMVRDNISTMKDFKPLTEEEFSAIDRVREVFRRKTESLIPCTACAYCTERCPKGINIPELFGCYNAKNMWNDWNSEFYYEDIHTKEGTRASDCIGCGICESRCPQHLPIRSLLSTVANTFEKKK